MAVEPRPANVSWPVSDVEPGYTTTEFWMAAVSQIVGLLTIFNVVHLTSAQTQGILGFAALVIPSALYAISRGIRKKGS